MNAHVLAHFRDLAETLSTRKRVPVTIEFITKPARKKEVIEAKYDGLFKTVELPVGTFPVGEIKTWLKLFYGADTGTVKITPNR
jgi:hypothetical protein